MYFYYLKQTEILTYSKKNHRCLLLTLLPSLSHPLFFSFKLTSLWFLYAFISKYKSVNTFLFPPSFSRKITYYFALCFSEFVSVIFFNVYFGSALILASGDILESAKRQGLLLTSPNPYVYGN